MRKRLTDLSVLRLKEPGETWDTLLPSFGIRIGARVKVWQVAIRRPGKKHPTRVKIGTFPDMKVAKARDKARELMAGGAPAEPVLFKEKIEEFLEYGRTRKGKPLRPESKRVYRSVLNSATKPLHRKAIADIRRRDISALLAAIERNGGPSHAALVKATLGRYWTWLMSTDDEITSPVVGVQAYEIPKRLRPLSDPELHAIWTATDSYEGFSAIIRICLWTGCRRSEAGGARWSELSPDGDVWCIPGSRTKNHRPVALPLPTQAVVYLQQVPRISGRDHLFGARSECGFNGWNHAKRRLDARLRFNEPWILHNIRATVETRMAGLGIPKEHVNKVLNHAAGPVTERYDGYDYMPEKAAALQAWADRLEEIVRFT